MDSLILVTTILITLLIFRYCTCNSTMQENYGTMFGFPANMTQKSFRFNNDGTYYYSPHPVHTSYNYNTLS